MRVVALPGRAYPVSLPVLAVPLAVLRERGHEVRAVSWDLGAPLDPPTQALLPDDPDAFVTGHLLAAAGDGCDLVVAKSLGTRAAACAAEQGWPAIWLTPLLTDPACVAGIRAGSAPQLLVGGDADDLWDVSLAASLATSVPGCRVLEVPGADHALSRIGDAALDAETERLLRDGVATFVDAL